MRFRAIKTSIFARSDMAVIKPENVLIRSRSIDVVEVAPVMSAMKFRAVKSEMALIWLCAAMVAASDRPALKSTFVKFEAAVISAAKDRPAFKSIDVIVDNAAADPATDRETKTSIAVIELATGISQTK